MYTSRTIANYFIKKHPDGDLTPMKLLKLVYVSYGWYLALTGKPLVEDKPEAWKLGPVFPDLYEQLKQYGGRNVTDPVIEHTSVMIDENDAQFLEFMWKKYGSFDGIKLSAITHTEGTPWSIVYPRGYNVVIPDDLIREHYSAMLLQPVEERQAVSPDAEESDELFGRIDQLKNDLAHFAETKNDPQLRREVERKLDAAQRTIEEHHQKLR